MVFSKDIFDWLIKYSRTSIFTPKNKFNHKCYNFRALACTKYSSNNLLKRHHASD